MQKASLFENLEFNETKVAVSVLLKTSNSSEVRILLKKDQVMKEHQAPFPIVIEVFDGVIQFGVNGENQTLNRGDIISLDASVPHDLKGISDSIIRLTIHKNDTIERINSIK
ncbi:cupin domain-containing protein [Flavobacterium hiemivividum]|uniref:Cupin n=1 Tax=Flavobacterium hiemivividum TaxID=2541734 RepID=A0A4R5CUI1_9FLAO|nr:cupin [Flavobacterium hiemivividum]TDE02611.1 cupin [Flavobacterium hiemivividum]